MDFYYTALLYVPKLVSYVDSRGDSRLLCAIYTDTRDYIICIHFGRASTRVRLGSGVCIGLLCILFFVTCAQDPPRAERRRRRRAGAITPFIRPGSRIIGPPNNSRGNRCVRVRFIIPAHRPYTRV